MAQKIIVTVPGSVSKDALASKRQSTADLLCVCPEDILFLTDGLTVSVLDLPDEMTAAREKADKEAEDAKEKAREEFEAAEATKLEAEKKAAADAAKAANPTPPPPAAVDYESWTAEELHAEASKRDLHGRGSMDKAALVKALTKADKNKG